METENQNKKKGKAKAKGKKPSKEAVEKVDHLKLKLGQLNDNIIKEYQLVKLERLDHSSPEVTKIIELINQVTALIPEIVALEKKLGMLSGSEKDSFLDQIIESLRKNSKFGKMWENAEKARQESEDTMAKEN